MKYFLLFALIIVLAGCGQEDNPKTKNELLRDKIISWTDDTAEYHEFLADGTLLSVGGDWPVEGFKGRQWESVDAGGSFKIIPDPARADTYFIARFQGTLAKGSKFTFKHFTAGVSDGAEAGEHTIQRWEDVKKSHIDTASSMDAQAHLQQYAEQNYMLDLFVRDPGGLIKKVPTKGGPISTEVMVTNAQRWNIEPVIPISQGKKPDLPIEFTMTIQYHNGDEDILHFKVGTIKDFTDTVFDDPWF